MFLARLRRGQFQSTTAHAIPAITHWRQTRRVSSAQQERFVPVVLAISPVRVIRRVSLVPTPLTTAFAGLDTGGGVY